MTYRNLPTKNRQEYLPDSVAYSAPINNKANTKNNPPAKKTVKNTNEKSTKNLTQSTQNSVANVTTKNLSKPVPETKSLDSLSSKVVTNNSINMTPDLSSKLLTNIPVNISDYKRQIENIRRASPTLYQKNKNIYQAINNWINQSLNIDEFYKVGLNKYKLSGGGNFRNVLLTGYYTPIVKARRQPDNQFKYPIYKMPTNLGRLPSRELIYKGALDGKGLELAYSDSLMGNFMMDIQGSAYIDFEDGTPLVYFSYAGRNGHDYSSLGRVLIEKGEVKRNQLSMQSVLAWAETQEEDKLKSLLMENNSFIFYNYQSNSEVKGSAGVPLIPNASVASDRSLIPSGSVMLVNVPLLDDNGKYLGENETRLMVALDTGSAIKGQHLDLYFGIGDNAGKQAGFYSHYAPVWIIKP